MYFNIKNYSRHTLLLTTILMLSIVGCDSPEYQLAPVSGQVTMGEQPIVDAQITFQPIADTANGKISVGPGSYGRTDSEGRYRLKTVDDDRSGAVVGQHSVVITKGQDNVGLDTDISTPTESGLPSQAADGSLEITIEPDGTETADFRFEAGP